MPERRSAATALTRRASLSVLGAAGLGLGLGMTARPARAAETIRIGLPTRAYWPTVIAEAANRQRLFAKEGIGAELSIYRGATEAFDALAAGSADLVIGPPALCAVALGRGVATKIVAAGSLSYLGWQLMVRDNAQTMRVEELAGKKVGITSAGSGSDILAHWTMQDRAIQFTCVALGASGLVPNLRAGNVDAAVLYPPLSLDLLHRDQARALLDYGTAVPAHVNAAWIASDTLIATNPALVQKALNALFGGLVYLRQHREAGIALIAAIEDIPPEIAALEYASCTMKLPTNGRMELAAVTRGLALSKLAGATGLAPAQQIISTQFVPVPTS
jgi:NitT/TauT family transport system substrate-binding protein